MSAFLRVAEHVYDYQSYNVTLKLCWYFCHKWLSEKELFSGSYTMSTNLSGKYSIVQKDSVFGIHKFQTIVLDVIIDTWDICTLRNAVFQKFKISFRHYSCESTYIIPMGILIIRIMA